MQELSINLPNSLFGTEEQLRLKPDGNNFHINIISKNLFQRLYSNCTGEEWSTKTKISNVSQLQREVQLHEREQIILDEYSSKFKDFSHYDALKEIMSDEYFSKRENCQLIVDKTSNLIRSIQYKNPKLSESLQENQINLRIDKEDLDTPSKGLESLEKKIDRITLPLISKIDYINSNNTYSLDSNIKKQLEEIRAICSKSGLIIPKIETPKPLKAKTLKALKTKIFMILSYIDTHIRLNTLKVDDQNLEKLSDLLYCLNTWTPNRVNLFSLSEKFLKIFPALRKNIEHPKENEVFVKLEKKVTSMSNLAREVVGLGLDSPYPFL